MPLESGWAGRSPGNLDSSADLSDPTAESRLLTVDREHDAEDEEDEVFDADESEADLDLKVREMLADNRVDRLIRRYERLYPDYKPRIEDVFLQQFEHMAIRAKTERIRNPYGLLRWLVKLRINDLLDESPGRYGVEEERRTLETPEALAEQSELFQDLKNIINKWPNRRRRLIVSLYLEAEFYGYDLSVAEVQTILREQFDEEMTVNNISQTHGRGWRALVADVHAMFEAEQKEQEL
jgi:hypothetical protein